MTENKVEKTNKAWRKFCFTEKTLKQRCINRGYMRFQTSPDGKPVRIYEEGDLYNL